MISHAGSALLNTLYRHANNFRLILRSVKFKSMKFIQQVSDPRDLNMDFRAYDNDFK